MSQLVFDLSNVKFSGSTSHLQTMDVDIAPFELSFDTGAVEWDGYQETLNND